MPATLDQVAAQIQGLERGRSTFADHRGHGLRTDVAEAIGAEQQAPHAGVAVDRPQHANGPVDAERLLAQIEAAVGQRGAAQEFGGLIDGL